MASSSTSTPATDERDRKRKRGGEPEPDKDTDTQAAPSKWRTRREHEIYSTKLLDALRLVRSGGSTPSPSPARAAGREVRDAADRALAVAARGRSRWSRAILASRTRRRRALRARVHAPAPALPPPPPPPPPNANSSSARAPALGRKAKALGRLVPGCRKLPFPALLSETSDYIGALEMQVRAMTALAEALSSVSAGTSSSSPA